MSGNIRLIVIEGLDGSGKSTQLELLHDNFSRRGIKAQTLKFPDYESKSSTLVQMYLNGELGELEDINLYAASAFYAADRYISFLTGWKKIYEAGGLYLADRYTTSNIIYQMARLPKNEWDEYIAWLWDFEFVKLKLPKPDAVIYLDMPPELSRNLIEARGKRDGIKMDIHERDIEYLKKCREAALYAAKKLGWLILKCSDDGYEVLTAGEMSVKIMSVIAGII